MTIYISRAWLLAGRREWIGLIILCLPALLVSMDLTVLHLAAPAISADLRPSASQLLWIVDIYGFMIAGFLITMGTLGDRVGRRRLLLIGAAAFGVASIFAAFATTAEMLIAARALLGVAGATLAPSTVALIRNMFHDTQQRTTAISIWFMSFMAGSAVGPLIGGALLEVAWWGSTFLIGVPVMALLLALGPTVLPEYRAPRPGGMDLPGTVTALVAVLSVMYGLKRMAEHGLAFSSLAIVAAGLAVTAIFLHRQQTAPSPLIDLGLFRLRTAGISVLALTIGAVAVGGVGYLTAQYLQLVAGLSPIMAGVWMLPPLLIGIVTTVLTPMIARRVGPGIKMAVGLAVASVGLLVTSRADGESGLSYIVAGLGLLFGGVMPVLMLGVDIVVAASPPERTGAASAITETAQELGIAVGIALLGSLATAVYRSGMRDAIPSEVPTGAADAARSTLGGATGVADQLSAGVLGAAGQAFTDGVQLASVVSAVLVAVTAVTAAVVLRRVPGPTAAAEHP